MGKIIIRSSSFEEELERQHRMRLMNNLFRKADGAVYEPININEYVKQIDNDKIDIQPRTAEAWGAFAVFLLGEIALSVYVTLNYGWLPVLCILSAAFITYTIIVFCNADNFNIKALIKCLIGIFCTCLLLFVADKIYKNIIEDDKSIRSAIAFATAIFGIASFMWSLILCGINNGINSRLRKQKRIKIEVARRKQEAEAKAKAEEERRRQEAERAKVEEERIRQKQPEYCNYCKELINNFWNNDFFDSDEETDVLLSRLRFTLENSKYFNWKTEFYDKVVEKIKATTRPPKSARSQQQSRATSLNSSGFNMYFNGILFTLEQYQILIHYPQVKDLYNEDLFAFCCMLAKKTPEFANFKQTVSDEVQEACNFMGVNYEDLSEDSLKKAYRRLYLQYLPDWNKSANAAEMFSKLQKSNEILLKELQLKRLKIY